ncbi:bZIP transcription factor 11 [Camellia lanceoleosa]|uniref:BZIP transcription factor 11 n=1 Tax=Camellia lanceoleosa TaxID=1840588 RepID=A0ACC0HNH1_9ERIC|nr:bZIP transcription factor 11 [Camellia lanceoleosa]
MASSSGNSSGSTQIQSHSGSEEHLQGKMDQRKRKRMESNRESARRSRMRKQKHLNDLVNQVAQLRKENNQINTSVSITTQHYLNVEAENSVLRAQMDELSQRLQSLNDILNYMNTNNGVFETQGFETSPDSFMNNSWNLMYLNQHPIMAAADIFQY